MGSYGLRPFVVSYGALDEALIFRHLQEMYVSSKNRPLYTCRFAK